MTYDFHGSWDFWPAGSQLTGFNSNLYTGTHAPKWSVDASVTAATELGIPASKLIMGIPAYGRSHADVKPTNGGLGQGLLAGAGSELPAGDLDDAACM